MFEPETKIVTRWYVEVGGTRYRFRKKELAIKMGKVSRTMTHSVKLIEEYDLFSRGMDGRLHNIDHQEFDRTILLLG